MTSGVPHDALRSMMPDPKLPYRVVRRVAGVGSLGRPRFVALAEWGGGLVAREAKAAVPSALVWTRRGEARTTDAARLLKRAIRIPDPFFAFRGDWVIRRLAPDCSRIDLGDLPGRRDEEKLLGRWDGKQPTCTSGLTDPVFAPICAGGRAAGWPMPRCG